jgi:hypothetical protein
MRRSAPDNSLPEYYCVTVILRLVLDDRGLVTYGEFVDVANTRHVHFVGWRGMLQAGRAWLKQQQQEVADNLKRYRDSQHCDE